MVNALEIIGKDISDVKIVVNGAGAAGIACANLAITMGIDKNNVILCDTKGVIYKGRTIGMNEYKERLAAETDARTLEDAMVAAARKFFKTEENLQARYDPETGTIEVFAVKQVVEEVVGRLGGGGIPRAQPPVDLQAVGDVLANAVLLYLICRRMLAGGGVDTELAGGHHEVEHEVVVAVDEAIGGRPPGDRSGALQ